ncbi:MAG: hypothetical protein ACJ8CB_35645 [Ktedonobacteraceae bacterium]|jgi:hypothetical protein
MMHQFLAVAQWINDANTAFLGIEGLVFGSALFGALLFFSLLAFVRNRARKHGEIL